MTLDLASFSGHYFKKINPSEGKSSRLLVCCPPPDFPSPLQIYFPFFVGKRFFFFSSDAVCYGSPPPPLLLLFQDRHRRKERKRKTHQVFLLSHIFSLLVFFSVDGCLLLKGLKKGDFSFGKVGKLFFYSILSKDRF